MFRSSTLFLSKLKSKPVKPAVLVKVSTSTPVSENQAAGETQFKTVTNAFAACMMKVNRDPKWKELTKDLKTTEKGKWVGEKYRAMSEKEKEKVLKEMRAIAATEPRSPTREKGVRKPTAALLLRKASLDEALKAEISALKHTERMAYIQQKWKAMSDAEREALVEESKSWPQKEKKRSQLQSGKHAVSKKLAAEEVKAFRQALISSFPVLEQAFDSSPTLVRKWYSRLSSKKATKTLVKAVEAESCGVSFSDIRDTYYSATGRTAGDFSAASEDLGLVKFRKGIFTILASHNVQRDEFYPIDKWYGILRAKLRSDADATPELAAEIEAISNGIPFQAIHQAFQETQPKMGGISVFTKSVYKDPKMKKKLETFSSLGERGKYISSLYRKLSKAQIEKLNFEAPYVQPKLESQTIYQRDSDIFAQLRQEYPRALLSLPDLEWKKLTRQWISLLKKYSEESRIPIPVVQKVGEISKGVPLSQIFATLKKNMGTFEHLACQKKFQSRLLESYPVVFRAFAKGQPKLWNRTTNRWYDFLLQCLAGSTPKRLQIFVEKNSSGVSFGDIKQIFDEVQPRVSALGHFMSKMYRDPVASEELASISSIADREALVRQWFEKLPEKDRVALSLSAPIVGSQTSFAKQMREERNFDEEFSSEDKNRLFKAFKIKILEHTFSEQTEEALELSGHERVSLLKRWYNDLSESELEQLEHEAPSLLNETRRSKRTDEMMTASSFAAHQNIRLSPSPSNEDSGLMSEEYSSSALFSHAGQSSTLMPSSSPDQQGNGSGRFSTGLNQRREDPGRSLFVKTVADRLQRASLKSLGSHPGDAQAVDEFLEQLERNREGLAPSNSEEDEDEEFTM